MAAAQAGVDNTRENQRLIYRELKNGTHPDDILELLKQDENIERRQFGIVDMLGHCTGFSGSRNGAASLSVQDTVPGTEIYFSIQGNILASDDVVHTAVAAFKSEDGTLTDRVMAAMDAADAAGGDVRCTCESEPVLEAPCEAKTAHVAYILAADPDDPEGESFNDGQCALYLSVTDDDILPEENANPVITLRMRYDAWKVGRGGGWKGGEPARSRETGREPIGTSRDTPVLRGSPGSLNGSGLATLVIDLGVADDVVATILVL